MNANTRLEIKARAFHAVTGYLAPYKDSPTASNEPNDLRMLAWNEWQRCYGQVVEAMLSAAAQVLERDPVDSP